MHKMPQIVASTSPRNAPRFIPPAIVKPSTGAPILLYDQVTVPNGGEQPFKSKAFTNNRNRRIQIHEMRCVSATNSVQPVVMPNALIALQLIVKRKNGKTFPITRGYVPVLAICRSDNRLGEMEASLGAATGILGANVWQFSTPIDLNPGDCIESQVKNLGLFNAPVIVDLAYAGADASGPTSSRVPYVTHWQSRDFAYAEAGFDSAPPDMLANDTGRDFHVDRIIGRVVTNNAGSVGDFGDPTPETDSFLRIATAQGKPILPAYSAFRAIFGQGAAVETDYFMAPGDFINVDVQHTAGNLGAPTYFQARALVSLVGWREVM
jgi:hypothetical protein